MADETKVESEASDQGRGTPIFCRTCCGCGGALFTAVKPKGAVKSKDKSGAGAVPLKSGSSLDPTDYVKGEAGYVVHRKGGKTHHAPMPKQFSRVDNLKYQASDQGRGTPIFCRTCCCSGTNK